jgi:hypothetical protein
MENYLRNTQYETNVPEPGLDVKTADSNPEDVFIFPDQSESDRAPVRSGARESWWTLMAYWIKEFAWRRRFWNQTR